MAKFRCEAHPALYVRDAGVRFVDGEAEADGKAADALRKLPEELGVVEVKSTASKRAQAEKL